MGMGIEVMGKIRMGMQCWTGTGTGIDIMEVGREWEQESHFCTPLNETL